MAEYNAWMNARMYALCATLADAERKKDRKAFFRSIHSTLNHILVCDLSFMASFAGAAQPPESDDDLHADFDALRQHRSEVDQLIDAWARSVQADWLESPSTYTHNDDGVPRTVTRGFWVVHMFNHQTHHRGQITTLLTQLGQDIGSTDLHGSVPLPKAGD
jgi:uncharacterized damage-inducible protein DinB